MDNQAASPQPETPVPPNGQAPVIAPVMVPGAVPPAAPAPPAPAAQPAPAAPTPAGTGTPGNIQLDGVESSFGDFLVKRWWVILLLLIGCGIIARFAPGWGIVLFFIALGVLKRLYENNLFQAFAKANNYTYQKKGSLPDQTGLIFFIGHSRKYSDIVSGMYRSWTFWLFMYTYTIGYGRNSQTYNRAVMAVNFNVALPAFVLRRHKLFQILEEEGESFKSNGYTEKVNLEGDFSEHFQVYIKPNSQVDVLSILSPDVMEMLKGLDKYEIEMAANGVFYIYCHGYITKKQSLIDVYTIVEAIAAKIGRYASREQLISEAAR